MGPLSCGEYILQVHHRSVSTIKKVVNEENEYKVTSQENEDESKDLNVIIRSGRAVKSPDRLNL